MKMVVAGSCNSRHSLLLVAVIFDSISKLQLFGLGFIFTYLIRLNSILKAATSR